MVMLVLVGLAVLLFLIPQLLMRLQGVLLLQAVAVALDMEIMVLLEAQVVVVQMAPPPVALELLDKALLGALAVLMEVLESHKVLVVEVVQVQSV